LLVGVCSAFPSRIQIPYRVSKGITFSRSSRVVFSRLLNTPSSRCCTIRESKWGGLYQKSMVEPEPCHRDRERGWRESVHWGRVRREDSERAGPVGGETTTRVHSASPERDFRAQVQSARSQRVQSGASPQRVQSGPSPQRESTARVQSAISECKSRARVHSGFSRGRARSARPPRESRARFPRAIPERESRAQFQSNGLCVQHRLHLWRLQNEFPGLCGGFP
jgi:hypothetical protein